MNTWQRLARGYCSAGLQPPRVSTRGRGTVQLEKPFRMVGFELKQVIATLGMAMGRWGAQVAAPKRVVN